VPYSITEAVADHLQTLESLGVLERADITEWGTPIVPVCQKGKSIRICADYKSTINKYLELDRYPIPHIDDILAKLHGGRYFCKLDISQAYLHIPVDDDTATLQTITMHLGNYKVRHMFFGMKNAPSI